jgi:MFS family permease
LVDIIAMVFAMPLALYPQIVDELGQLQYLGWLYAAIPLGAGFISVFSKPLDKVQRQGAGVIVSATIWGVFIVVMAFSTDVRMMAACLFVAGMADAVSGIYRQTIWNEVIPTNIRGRLGSLNMLSYMIGPLIGNARAGAVASVSTTHFSILSGGILCVLGCVGSVWLFPKFWSYQRTTTEDGPSS